MLRLLLLTFLLFCSLFSNIVSQELSDDDPIYKNVIIYNTDENKDILEIFMLKKYSLVMFHAPWCGHCKQFKPHFAEAATELAEEVDIQLVMVDCTVHSDVCEMYSVSGYPTIKVFENGEFHSDYDSERNSHGVVQAMLKFVTTKTVLLNNVVDLENYLNSHQSRVVAIINESTAEIYKKVADFFLGDYIFAYTHSKEVGEEIVKKATECSSRDECVVVFDSPQHANKHESSARVYTGEINEIELKKGIMPLLFGLAGFRNKKSEKYVQLPMLTFYMNTDIVSNSAYIGYFRNRLLKISKSLKKTNPDISCVLSSEDDFSKELESLGYTDVSAGDAKVVFKKENGKKYVYTEKISVDTMIDWITNVVGDKIDPYLKSEEIPQDASEGAISIVGKNFESIVHDPTKDVLIEFYAPWCGHCKSLAPKYDELAKQLEPESNLVIAKMDATANDIPEQYSVSGFPTIYYVPKDNVPVVYEGGREVPEFIAYLAENREEGLTGYNRDGSAKKSEL